MSRKQTVCAIETAAREFVQRRERCLDMDSYTAIVERCPATGLYVGCVPALLGAHSQGESLAELAANLREVVELVLEWDESCIVGEGMDKPSRADGICITMQGDTDV